jgi:nitrite reductase/ring-hydroxylating ferredoxin subunit
MDTDDLRWVDVAASSELAKGSAKVFAIGARKVAVVHHDGNYSAFKDQCPHLNLPLAESGCVSDSSISCPHHGWVFDLASGEGPHGSCLRTYPVRIDGDRITVGV